MFLVKDKYHALMSHSLLHILGEGLRDNQREHKGSFSVDLHGMSINADLSPGNGLLRSSTSVTSIELLSSIDVHGEVGAVAHEVGIADMVLHHSSSDDNLTGLGSVLGNAVDGDDVLDQIDNQTGVHVGVEEEHVTNRTVGDGRAEHRDVVLCTPVVHGLLVVNALTHELDHLGRSPDVVLLLLLLQHVVQDGHHPVLEIAVVVVRDKQVSRAVDSLHAQVAAVQIELTNVELGHALDEVLLNSSASSDNHINLLMTIDKPC